jgi:hypothetical protein
MNSERRVSFGTGAVAADYAVRMFTEGFISANGA